MILPAIASDSVSDNNRSQYIQRVLPEYLALEPELSYDGLTISQGFQIMNREDSNTRAYFIFDDQNHIGTLTVVEASGNYYSTFRFESNE